jgi:hypothetical protein
MNRAAGVLALLPLFLGPAAACSKFGATDGETTDAGEVPDAADTGTATLEHRIYAFGGVTAVPGAVPIKSAYFSIVAPNGDLGSWTRLPALDDLRVAAAWAQIGDTLFAAGGSAPMQPFSVDGLSAALPRDAADPAAIWIKTASLSTGRIGAAALAHGKSFYVSGGQNAAGALQDIQRYDTSDSWSGAGSLNLAVAGHAMFLRNSLLYVIGGDRLGTSGATVAVAKAPLMDDQSVGSFSGGGDLTFPLAYHVVALVEPYVFAIGGANQAGASGKVARGVFDANGVVTWSTISPLPVPSGQNGLAEACAVVIDRTIYVMGGRDVRTAASKADVYIGRVDPNGVISWTTSPSSLPEGRAALGCAVSSSSAP